MTIETQTITVKGERFVLVPEHEFERLQRLDDVDLPPLPPADEHGNRPAVETCTVILARKLIRRRRELGLSQVELARRAGVRPETINRLEAAKHVPSIATVDKIDRALKEAEKAAKPPATRKKPRKR
jgi:DNA-binding XRE family transcriptional regulator